MRVARFVVRITIASLAFAAAQAADAVKSANPGLSLLLEFSATAGELPESLTMDRAGNWYFSMGNQVRKVTAYSREGTFTRSVYATLPIAGLSAGLKFGRDDCLYAGSISTAAASPGSWIWRLCPAAPPEIYATLAPNGFPNDIAFDEHGNLFATDPRLGRIWKITARTRAVSAWKEDPSLAGDPTKSRFGVDGIAFDPGQRNLYVNNLDFGRVLSIPVQKNGDAGAIEQVVADARLAGADGMAFDRRGTLYMVVNTQDRLVSISRKGEIQVLAEGAPLDGPSSLVFGTRGSDRQVLYIANFAVDRARGRKPGAPHPSLLRYPTRVPGLSLPD